MLGARMHRLLAQPSPLSDLPPWLLLIAAALAGVLIWRTLAPPSWRNWHFQRAGAAPRTDPLSQPQPPTSLAQQRAVERDMQLLMQELSEMSRKIVQQLDGRSAKLQELLKQADERIERLAELEQRAAASREEVRHSAPTTADAAPPPTPSSEPQISIEIDPRHERIYALEDEGLSAVQISNQLNIPEGEVELILALRPRRRAAG